MQHATLVNGKIRPSASPLVSSSPGNTNSSRLLIIKSLYLSDTQHVFRQVHYHVVFATEVLDSTDVSQLRHLSNMEHESISSHYFSDDRHAQTFEQRFDILIAFKGDKLIS